MSFSDAMDTEIAVQEPPGEGYMYSLETESFFQQVSCFNLLSVRQQINLLWSKSLKHQ